MGAVRDTFDAGGPHVPSEAQAWGEAASDAVDAATDHAADTTTAHGGIIADDDSRLTDARTAAESTVSQAEAEAGTATTRRIWTAERVSQAIAALGGGSDDTALNHILEAAHGNRALWPIYDRCRRDGIVTNQDIGTDITTLDSGQDWEIEVADGFSVNEAHYSPDGHIYLLPSSTDSEPQLFLLTDRPSAWDDALSSFYRVSATYEIEQTVNWYRVLLLAYLDVDNYIAIEMGNYIAQLVKVISGTKTQMGTIWTDGGTTSGASVQNNNLLTVSGQIQRVHSSFSAISMGVNCQIDGRSADGNPIGLTSDCSIFFDVPAKIGFGDGRGVYLYGFAARGTAL